MFFFCYFLWPWSHSFVVALHNLGCSNLRVSVIGVMDFSKEIMFPMEVPLEMDCCALFMGLKSLQHQYH
jgi:hypothetical protein